MTGHHLLTIALRVRLHLSLLLLFQDIINIFLYLLALFGGNDR